MHHVSAQGVDERMINVDYYYILKIILAFDWQPLKRLEQWSNIFMSALAKNVTCEV